MTDSDNNNYSIPSGIHVNSGRIGLDKKGIESMSPREVAFAVWESKDKVTVPQIKVVLFE
jgi:hypothetical protein